MSKGSLHPVFTPAVVCNQPLTRRRSLLSQATNTGQFLHSPCLSAKRRRSISIPEFYGRSRFSSPRGLLSRRPGDPLPPAPGPGDVVDRRLLRRRRRVRAPGQRHHPRPPPLTLDQRVSLRLATTHGIRLAVKAVDTVYNAAGATAIYESCPIQRHFQDIHVITQHLQGRLAHYELVGRYWLGLPIDEMRL